MEAEEETSVTLSPQLLSEIQSHASTTYPEECCGLMFGEQVSKDIHTSNVRRIKKMRNAFESSERHHRYTIDPKEFLTAENEAAERKEELVGVYHSHPNVPPNPSEFDLRHAWPLISYLIVEVRERKSAEIKSWRFDVDRRAFIPEQILVIDEEKEGEGRKENSTIGDN